MIKVKKLEEAKQPLSPRHIITSRKRLKLKKIKKIKRSNKKISIKTKKTKKHGKFQKYNINMEPIFNINYPEKENLNQSNSQEKKIELENNIFSEAKERNEIGIRNIYNNTNEIKINKFEESYLSSIFKRKDNNNHQNYNNNYNNILENRYLHNLHVNDRILNTSNEFSSLFDSIIDTDVYPQPLSLSYPSKNLNFYQDKYNLSNISQEIRFHNNNENTPQIQHNIPISNSNFFNNQEINENLNNISIPIYSNQNNNRNIHNIITNNRNNNNNIINNNRFNTNLSSLSTFNLEYQNDNRNNNIINNNLDLNNRIYNIIDNNSINLYRIDNFRNDRYFSPSRDIVHQNIKSIKENLTKTKIKKVINLEDNKKNCIICLNEFKNGQNIYTLPCSHIFHVRCLNKEIRIRQKCPICRKKLKEN